MMEWLAGDPLNGLVITIAFFLSVIIGRHLRKTRTRMPLHNIIESRIKLISSLLLIFAVTLMRHWYFPVIISTLCAIIALHLDLIREYLKKMIFPVVLGSFILAVQGSTFGVNRITFGNIGLYSDGIDYGFLIFSRIIASASILILLVLSTSHEDMLRNLRWLRVPGTLLEISSFMLRYIMTFSLEANTLKLAQVSRCGFPGNSSFSSRLHNITSIYGLLIARAFVRSQDVHRAMIARGWKPQQYLKNNENLGHMDKMIGAVIFSGILALVIFDRLL